VADGETKDSKENGNILHELIVGVLLLISLWIHFSLLVLFQNIWSATFILYDGALILDVWAHFYYITVPYSSVTYVY